VDDVGADAVVDSWKQKPTELSTAVVPTNAGAWGTSAVVTVSEAEKRTLSAPPLTEYCCATCVADRPVLDATTYAMLIVDEAACGGTETSVVHRVA
jgi:hypothetical protein